MQIKNYKIIDDGIWIPKSELARMIEDSYKAALGYDKARKEKGDSAYEAAMLRTQGGAEAYEYLYKQFEQNNKDTKFHVGDRIRKINRKEFDRDMSVERVYKDYYLCNNIGKFSSTTIPFAEEDDYELIKEG